MSDNKPSAEALEAAEHIQDCIWQAPVYLTIEEKIHCTALALDRFAAKRVAELYGVKPIVRMSREELAELYPAAVKAGRAKP